MGCRIHQPSKGAPWDFKSSAGEGIEEGVVPERTIPLDPPVDLSPRMRTRHSQNGSGEIRTDERMSGLSESYERCRALWQPTMMNAEVIRDPEEADRVVRTKTRINELARHIEEHDERAKKIAKHDHHKASSGKNQASSSSSSGVVS